MVIRKIEEVGNFFFSTTKMCITVEKIVNWRSFFCVMSWMWCYVLRTLKNRGVLLEDLSVFQTGPKRLGSHTHTHTHQWQWWLLFCQTYATHAQIESVGLVANRSVISIGGNSLRKFSQCPFFSHFHFSPYSNQPLNPSRIMLCTLRAFWFEDQLLWSNAQYLCVMQQSKIYRKCTLSTS